MLSLENIAAVKVAVEICNNIELKKIMLPKTNGITLDEKWLWNERVERKAVAIIKIQNLPEKLQEKVIAFILLIGMRMVIWSVYHKRFFGISLEDSLKFLNSSLFTSLGVIDDKKAAEALLNDKSLSTKQRYDLACVYCFTDHINALYSQASEDRFYFEAEQYIKSPLVIFWSKYLKGDIHRGSANLDLHRFHDAVASGSKAAVEYCLERTSISEYDVQHAALTAMKLGTRMDNESIIFGRINDKNHLRMPSDFYIDIVSFLLSKMREDQLIEFIKKNSEIEYHSVRYFGCMEKFRVLEYFLSWPYQNLFMKTAELVWDVLPERDYAALLLMICDKIEPKLGRRDWEYGEERIFNYRGLLNEFWGKSPEPKKKYVLSNQVIYEKYGTEKVTKSGSGLLILLLSLKNFTYEDGQIIKTILASAMENIISSGEWIDFCIQLIKKEQWEILNRFAFNCFSSKEEAEKFKRNLIFTDRVKDIFFDFLTNEKWSAAESFLKWNFLPEERINQLKKEMIDPKDVAKLMGRKCDVEVANRIFKWCLFSEEHVRQLKTKFIFSDVRVLHFEGLILENKVDLADKYINWLLSSQDKIKEFKRELAYRSNICYEYLTSYYSWRYLNGEQIGKWEIIEKFLTWCFSSEDEISEFKKEKILKISGKDIHFRLILHEQWAEAETFFAWLGLSAEEIKELKKETLYYKPIDMIHRYVSNQLYEDEFYFYRNKPGAIEFLKRWRQPEAIELLLRWLLSDKETVLEFQDKFKSMYQMNEEVLKTFDLAIARRLSDLDEEKAGLKRKSETCFPNKRFCTQK